MDLNRCRPAQMLEQRSPHILHLERKKPPAAALWVAWLALKTIPAGISVTAETIWRAHNSRFIGHIKA